MSVSAFTKAPWRFQLCRLVAWAALSLLAVPSGAATYVLSGAAGDDLAVSGDLDITGDLTLTGAGTASTIIDGGGVDRVFDIDPSGVGVSVTVANLTVRGGNP